MTTLLMLALSIVNDTRVPPRLPDSVLQYHLVSLDTSAGGQRVRAHYENHRLRVDVEIDRSSQPLIPSAAHAQIDQFVNSLDSLRRAGRLADFRIAYIDPARIALGDSSARGYTTAVPIRWRSGAVAVAIVSAYVYGTQCIVLRSVASQGALSDTDLREFARLLLAKLAAEPTRRLRSGVGRA